jgi:CBS domain-containing protein
MNSTSAAALTALARTPVETVMHAGLIECAPDDDVATVARTMARHRVHCVVVAGIERRGTSGQHLTWGILSDLDLVRALREGAVDRPAGELAGSEVILVDPDDTLEHAAQLMADHEVAHLVVAPADPARPLGMVSTLDVARVATA